MHGPALARRRGHGCRSLRYRPGDGACGTTTTGGRARTRLETVIDDARETGDPTVLRRDRQHLRHEQGVNFDEFGFYDDDGWWAITLIKASTSCHQHKYLDMAKTTSSACGRLISACCAGSTASAKAGSDGLRTRTPAPTAVHACRREAAPAHAGRRGRGHLPLLGERELACSSTVNASARHQVVDGATGSRRARAGRPVFTYNDVVPRGRARRSRGRHVDATLLDSDATRPRDDEAHADANARCGRRRGRRHLHAVQRRFHFATSPCSIGARPLPSFQVFMRHIAQLWNSNRPRRTIRLRVDVPF